MKAVSVVLARSAPAIKTASEVDASFGHVSVFVSSESTNLMREAISMQSGRHPGAAAIRKTNTGPEAIREVIRQAIRQVIRGSSALPHESAR